MWIIMIDAQLNIYLLGTSSKMLKTTIVLLCLFASLSVAIDEKDFKEKVINSLSTKIGSARGSHVFNVTNLVLRIQFFKNLIAIKC